MIMRLVLSDYGFRLCCRVEGGLHATHHLLLPLLPLLLLPLLPVLLLPLLPLLLLPLLVIMIVLPPLSLLQRGGVHATHLLTFCYYHYYYWGCCTKKAKSGIISKLPITSPPRWELLPIIPIFKEHPLLLWPILLLNFYYYHYTVTTITAVTTITTWYHYYYHHLSANYFVIHLIHLGRYQQTPDMVIPRQSPLLGHSETQSVAVGKGKKRFG